MRAWVGIASLACVVALSSAASARQDGGNGNNNNLGGFFGFGEIGNVGGIVVNPAGAIEAAPGKLSDADLKRLRDLIQQANGADLQTTAPLRKVSLRGLYQAVEQAVNAQQPLTPDVAFMAGLQRIEYVIVSPEQGDIILAGPAEGWRVDESGNVVGKTTGCPVLRLEDFIVALRTVENARRDAGISCSINPTEEGAKALSKLLDGITEFRPEAAKAIEETCGPQVITLTGLPNTSRFAQVLVAADYKMKRLSMGFEPAPIDGLPSYLEIAQKKATGRSTSSPRFWMECDYQPLARSEDGLTWQLRGQGVKTLVEEGRLDASGKRIATDKRNPLASQWAETMTERFDDLAKQEPAFRELRNLMDMSVVAALLTQENMLERAGLELPLFHDPKQLPVSEYRTPESVPTQCSFVRLTSSWLVTASGGVQIDPWSVVAQSEVVADLANAALVRQANANQWWWN
jgi:hypothetical protein